MGKEYGFEAGKAGQFTDDTLTASEDWIYITPNVEKLNNIIYKDGENGEQLSDVASSLANIKSLVASTVIMTKGEGGQAKDTEIGNLLSGVEGVATAKESLTKIALAEEIKQFNDKLEKAKVKAQRKVLRQACETFNAQKHVLSYRIIPAGSRSGQSWPETKVPNYDTIAYDFGITAWDTFLDMKTSTMFKEIEKRETKYGITLIPQSLKETMVRPTDT